MDKKFTSYAAIKAFYEVGRDIYDVFGDMLILVILSNEVLSIQQISSSFKKKYEIDIPHDVLTTILKRLRKEQKVTYDSLKSEIVPSITRTDIGNRSAVIIEEEYNKAGREKNALLKQLRRESGNEYTLEELEVQLFRFIENNTSDASLLLANNNHKLSKSNSEVERFFINFIKKTEESDQVNFERLKSLVFGRIISCTILNRKFERNAKFSKITVYLDTNIVFSLLSFHEEEFNKPAKELAVILNELGCQIRIFSFTKEQIISKLKNYTSNYHIYSSEVKVDSIYHILKRKNYSKSDVLIFIENIDEELSKINITVDYEFDRELLVKDNDILATHFERQKPLQHALSMKHDVASIVAIRKLRGQSKAYILEKTKYLFLTADFMLSSISFNSGHKDNGTIPEAIFRSDLASILWLKGINGSDNAFMHNFIANEVRNDIISNSLWIEFIKALNLAKEKGSISQDDIEFIISVEETEKILKEYKEEGIKLILSDSRIKENLDKRRSLEAEFATTNDLLNAKVEQINRIGKIVESNCGKTWRQIVNCGLWIAMVIITGVWIYLSISFNVWNYLGLLLLVPFVDMRFNIVKYLPKFITDKLPSINWYKLRRDFEIKKINSCVVKSKKKIGLINEK